MTLAVDDVGGTVRAIEGDITNLDVGIPSNVQDITGIDSTGYERLLLLADFSLTLNGLVCTDALAASPTHSGSHAVFQHVPNTAVTRTITIAHSGQSLGNECIITDYQWARGADGSLVFQAPAQLNSTTVPAWS